MIGGNIDALIQFSATNKNAIGESVKSWMSAQTVHGFLDLMSGDAKYSNFNAKIQESTHVFICDYVELDPRITSENSRMLIQDKIYDIVLIDNPMELNQHIEFYLTYTGGQ